MPLASVRACSTPVSASCAPALHRVAVQLGQDRPHRSVVERATTKCIHHQARVQEVPRDVARGEPIPQVEHRLQAGIGDRGRRACDEPRHPRWVAGGDQHRHARPQRVPDEVRALNSSRIHGDQHVPCQLLEAKSRARVGRLARAARIEEQAAEPGREPADHPRPGAAVGKSAGYQDQVRPASDQLVGERQFRTRRLRFRA